MSAVAETNRLQQEAADPMISAFVTANAGAGKTRVLTNRVARLLLAGARPDKILCITFTKAAAAEMAERLFKTLGEWALSSDDALRVTLAEIEGEGSTDRNARALAEARRLFARSLETPGGLKIQTIHSFCEQTLKRFPLEAGVAPGFTVFEEGEATQLLGAAIDDCARDNAPPLRAALSRLAAAHNEGDLKKFLTRGARAKISPETLQLAAAKFAERLGINQGTEETAPRSDFLNALDKERIEAARDVFAEGGRNAQKYLVAPLSIYLNASDEEEKWGALRSSLLTKEGTPRADIGDNKTKAAGPWTVPYIEDLQRRMLDAETQLKSIKLFHDALAFWRLAADIAARYEASKAVRAALDFDDLISGAQRLLKRTDAAWVRYKLDQGVDHVLIDETQDTSPAQWDIIERLLAEHLAGDGAPRETPRSFFAVGDMKQSIYSFQGADAALFEEKEAVLGKALAAVGPYENVELQLSFRSTAPVLRFVDQLFVEEGAREGFGKFGVPEHLVHRDGAAGLVEIWPLTPRPERASTNAWDMPVDAPIANHPVRTLTEAVAQKIKTWLEEHTMLESAGRAIRPDDIMVLVQSRGALFDAVIRTLALRGVPVAGADRLKLLEDPAVEDLLSYARAALYSGDDLSLAEVLKSPLFGFEDDADLFPLAHGRAPGETLWTRLSRKAEEKQVWEAARRQISAARKVGLAGGPYAFFSHILESGAPSGRKRIYERLSEAARDSVDELLRQALEFERSRPRSLGGFINWFEENAGEIKREMERAEGAVRVMTVHGSKGLEAPIVFLLDAHRPPVVGEKGLIADFAVSDDGVLRLPVLAGGALKGHPLVTAARDNSKREEYEEYRRRFYVAATRARDCLYICGVKHGKEKDPRAKDASLKSWHALALDAFDRLKGDVEVDDEAFWADGDDPIRRLRSEQTIAPKVEAAQAPPPAVETPPWFSAPAPQETAPATLAPSRLVDEEDEAASATQPALSPTASDRYFRGRILHRLLELLPEIEETARLAASNALLEKLASDIDDEIRAAWREEALGVLNDPKFADAFGPGSRAEVPIGGALTIGERRIRLSGQIDRLLVTDKHILAIDYKTNRPPPQRPEETAPAYLAQMAAYRALLQEIYPTHQIECALLWTFEARLMALPDEILDHAFARYIAAG